MGPSPSDIPFEHIDVAVQQLVASLTAIGDLLLWSPSWVLFPNPTPGIASDGISLTLISIPTRRWLQVDVCVPCSPPFRSRVSHHLNHTYLWDNTRSPWVTHASSPPCRPQTPWFDEVEPNAFATIMQAQPFSIFGRPVHRLGWLPLITTQWFSASP